MTRILFLAYHFPPVGGAGVQRNGKFARYLPDFDVESVVVTGPGRSEDRWTPTDETMLRDVPHGTEIVRIPGPEPQPSSGWRARGERWLGLRTPWLRWLLAGMEEQGLRHGRGVDVVYASLVPYDLAEAAAALSQQLGVPWVADLQDPWALDEMMVFASAAHRARELRRMRRLLGSAAAIVMNTTEAGARLGARFPELAGRTVVIPNGFEDADFAKPRALTTTAAFRIVHTGYLHTAAGRRELRLRHLRRILGGAAHGVDILARSHVPLLEAVDEIVRSGAVVPGLVEVHLAGVLSPEDLAFAERYPFVHLHGYLPHEEAIALMQSADLLYLPMQGLPPGTRATIVPGKTYEYLASGTAILAAVPEGDARDLLTEAGKTWTVPPGDRAAIGAAIVAAAQGSEPERPERSRTVLLRYERRHLTSRLAATLELVARDAARETTARREPERASAAAARVPGAEAAR